ncbi:ragulator complex protein LAMTOR3-like protein [Zopfochytrium polystomum]|nr:ragulator complex protein LAMTOR3-like protein [Zopfochytrium polystomum]
MGFDELHQWLTHILKSTDDLGAILITDKDGVIVIKVETPNLPARVTKAALSATFSMSCDQAGKIGLGRPLMVMSAFDEYQIVQFNYAPLILSFIAPSTANSGILLDIGGQLRPQVERLAQILNPST